MAMMVMSGWTVFMTMIMATAAVVLVLVSVIMATAAVVLVLVSVIMATAAVVLVLVSVIMTAATIVLMVMSMIMAAAVGLAACVFGVGGEHVEQSHNSQSDAGDEHHLTEDAIRRQVGCDATAGVEIEQNGAP
jgi:high-affinity Fe2+/Pb2+ permease